MTDVEVVANEDTGRLEGKFATDLLPLVVPIGSLQTHPENPRKGVVESIAGSLDRFGQTKPIIVQKSTGYVCAGNHTYLAAQSLGWAGVARVEMDWDDETARAYLVADNRLSDIAENDDTALGKILEELMLAGQLQGTGYTPEDVDDLMAKLDALDEVMANFEGEYAESPEETAARYREPGEVVPQRQYIIMIPTTESEGFDHNINTLKKAWGIDDFRSIIREALKRCVEAV